MKDIKSLANNIEELLEILPSGSGIDSDWIISSNETALICENAYHVMHEIGYYVGYAEFTINIPFDNPLEFTLIPTTSYSKELFDEYLLQDYLEDLFANWIYEEILKE